MELNPQIQHATELIQQARHIVAMTGAGISTLSGIPDFRSPNSGLWDSADPLEVASIHAFRRNPKLFYDWIHPISQLFMDARPNAAHRALAQLERSGKLKAIITQNIDDLHTQAGSQTVFELHGHLRELTCVQCYRVTPAEQVMAKFVADGQVPHCAYCGGVLKPNVILFGEQLPMQEFVAAQVVLEKADLLLVVGSSLEVSPASDLPLVALDNGARLIIINQQPTHLDAQANLVIRGDIATVLSAITNAVLA